MWERVGVGDGTVGVRVGVLVIVAVSVGWIKVGVGVYVLVSGGIVGVVCGDGVEAIGVDAGVFVGREAVRVGGTRIPAKSIEVALKPMKSPRLRYLMSARIMGGIFVTFQRLTTETKGFAEKSF